MSAKFEVGEIAILQNIAPPYAHENGDEVEVVGELAFRHSVTIHGEPFSGDSYRIRHRGRVWLVAPHCLRKKPRPGDEASWGAIERLTGWNPTKVAA